jgi:predicted secreted protein
MVDTTFPMFLHSHFSLFLAGWWLVACCTHHLHVRSQEPNKQPPPTTTANNPKHHTHTRGSLHTRTHIHTSIRHSPSIALHLSIHPNRATKSLACHTHRVTVVPVAPPTSEQASTHYQSGFECHLLVAVGVEFDSNKTKIQNVAAS